MLLRYGVCSQQPIFLDKFTSFLYKVTAVKLSIELMARLGLRKPHLT